MSVDKLDGHVWTDEDLEDFWRATGVDFRPERQCKGLLAASRHNDPSARIVQPM